METKDSIEEEGQTLHEIIENMTDQERWQYAAYMVLLLQSDRFKEFIKNNYDIHQEVDSEKRIANLAIIERPVAQGPKLTPAQIFKIHGILAQNGTKDVVNCTKSILNALGQESSVLVTDLPTPSKIIS